MATPEPADDTTEDRTRLATFVKKRRRELGLSVRAAADRGGVARGTWTALEDGSRRTSDSNYAGVERALFWTTGSIEAILAGRKPIAEPVSIGHTTGASTTTYTSSTGGVVRTGTHQDADKDDPALTKVMRSDLSDDKKRKLVRLLIAEREDAERRRVARAEDLIRLVADEE